ncbi:MAG: Na+/H+ antiporter NhaA [Chlorobi bacterium]|nr:Na+/H+ antiporter NhaA [Chlorobiota bacterium]
MPDNVFLSPVQKFVKLESFAGILLFGATIVALIWANSGFAASYQSLLNYKIGISFKDFEIRKPLILWINDGLMAIFFFFIGLELKRELLIGEINTIKKAAFPLIAALGGVIIPVIFFLTLNQNPETVKGWGVPMATDIAFALAILAILGKRVPLSLKIFLTAFAIIDDIAAVIVIAVFYSTGIKWMLLLYALVLIIVLALIYKKKYSREIGIIFSIVIWFLFLKSGIHPTIAGVLLAFTVPIRRKTDVKSFSKRLKMIADTILKSSEKNNENILLTKEEAETIDKLDALSCNVRSPLQHLEHKLHNWIAYFILPVFAFANAGVIVSGNTEFDFSLMFNIAFSLLVGKFIGVALFSYLGIKLKIIELPSGVYFKQIIGIAAVAGVGFTMSMFINNLAFPGDFSSINSVKLGIIIGSLIAGFSGYFILRFTSKK